MTDKVSRDVHEVVEPIIQSMKKEIGKIDVSSVRGSSPAWLADLLAALGWQGGTIHQALAEVRRLREMEASK